MHFGEFCRQAVPRENDGCDPLPTELGDGTQTPGSGYYLVIVTCRFDSNGIDQPHLADGLGELDQVPTSGVAAHVYYGLVDLLHRNHLHGELLTFNLRLSHASDFHRKFAGVEFAVRIDLRY